MNIKCPRCDTVNPSDSKFCKECATPLPSLTKGPVPITKTLETQIEELSTGSTFAGRYKIVEELGTGGMGKVYKAVDKKLNEEVALKLIKPEISSDRKTLERFSQELRIARKIVHKNVGRMYELMEAGGTHFITMEFVSGQDLRGLIRQTGKLAAETAVSIAKQVCQGLSEAHKLGIVHRDLKPSNIMIDREGQARIMDFGIARSLKGKAMTGEGMVIGTPEYMSPEQVEGKEADARSDIYSLGIILYEMVTGRVPFEGDTPLSVGVMQKAGTPENPKKLNPNIPDSLNALILNCLEKDRGERPQSADELATRLGSVLLEFPAGERPAAKKRLTSRQITVSFSAKKLVFPIGLIAVLAIAGFLLWKFLIPAKKPVLHAKKASVAVMLFDDLSPERNRGDLCQGIAESLISALSKISGLRVPARTSSFAFKGPDKDVRSIGEKLNVTSILEGSVQVSGSRLRVTTNLIDTADEAVLWSEEFDKELNDVFSIQDEIALKVVGKLRVNLMGEERAKLTRHGTANAEAYELYLKGKHFRYTERPKEMLRAKDYFEEAIRKDPNYAAAYAGHAENCMVLGLYSALPRDEAAIKARHAAEKALEIDPDLSEAHVSMGVVKMVFDWDWKGAEREFQRAIALNPNNLDAHCEYGLLLTRNFRYDQSEQEFIRSQELDPLNSLPLRDMQWLYLSMGLTDKADEVNKKLREIDPFWANTGFKVERSVEDAEKLTQEYGRYPLTLLYLAVAHYQKGNYREATKIIQELEMLYEKDRQGNEAYFLAIYFSYTLHDIDKSLMWLNRAVEGRAPALINVSIPIYFTFLQKEPRFQEVLKKVGLK